MEFIKGVTRVPPRNQVVDWHERLNVYQAASTEIYTYGVFSKEFSKRICEFVGAKFCVLCNSGSSANLLAVSALTSPLLGENRLRPGDEVITTALNFPTTVNPIVQCGLVPVFVDIDLPYYTVCGHHKYIREIYRTKAAVFSNTLGNWQQAIAPSPFILDCCDSVTSDNKCLANIRTYSFYPAHHITTGEGGAVCTDDPLLYRILKSFRDWGRDCWCDPGQNNTCGKRFDGSYDHKYVYSHIGYNLKMTEMQAAIGVAQMGKLPIFIEARRRNFQYYYKGLKDLKEIFILPEATPGSNPSWFGFPLTFRDGRDCQDFCRRLDDKGIEVRRMFAGNITKQPAYKDVKYRIIGDLKNTDFVATAGFWIFVSPSLTDEMMDYVIEVIHAEVK